MSDPTIADRKPTPTNRRIQECPNRRLPTRNPLC